MSWITLILYLLVASIKNKVSNEKKSVSVVIPAFNESNNVDKVIRVVKSLNLIDEVIVVDDGSTDTTAQVAEEAGAIVIKHKTNLGKGAALKTGFKKSVGDIIAFIDADLKSITSDQVEKIIKPILDGKADITKTKFKRKAGRVTELTAKPLLSFFFPELNYEQPLSGQFAALKSFLDDIKFEDDYGVDVGIVLDADVRGVRIHEVDIGNIEHKHSPIKGLNIMANQVVRTIVDRAIEYGRVTMMDTLGKYIRNCILGLSLTSLGLFSIFFINKIPAILGVIMLVVGIIIAGFYTFKIIRRTYKVISKSETRSTALKSFFYMQAPILISMLILVAMIFSFIGNVHIDSNEIDIQPASGNLIIPIGNILKSEIRGPYTIDSALEDEYSIMRMPSEALSTLGLNYGDLVFINGKKYSLNQTAAGEPDTIRMPLDARNHLGVDIGTVILDANLRNVFKNVYAEKALPLDPSLNTSVQSLWEGILINPGYENGRIVNVYVDGDKISSNAGIMSNGMYSIYINGTRYDFNFNTNDASKSTTINWKSHVIKVEVGSAAASNVFFVSSDEGQFLNITFN